MSKYERPWILYFGNSDDRAPEAKRINLLPTRPSARRILTALAVTAGVVIGVLGLVITAQGSVEMDPNSSVWLTSRFRMFGWGLLGLVFLAGSFAALRNARRAGFIFCSAAPILAFLLSYPSAGYLVWTDGGGVFELPLLRTAIVLACLFYIPFIAPLFAIRHRKRALFLFLIPAMVVVAVFAASRWSAALLPRVAAWSALFLVFGAFWLRTDKLGWSTLLATGPRSPGRILVTVFAEWSLTALLLLAGIFTSTVLCATSRWSIDCRGPGFFVRPVSPDHMVFTARMAWAGHVTKVSGRWAGDWAIGLVRDGSGAFPRGLRALFC